MTTVGAGHGDQPVDPVAMVFQQRLRHSGGDGAFQGGEIGRRGRINGDDDQPRHGQCINVEPCAKPRL